MQHNGIITSALLLFGSDLVVTVALLFNSATICPFSSFVLPALHLCSEPAV